MPWEPEGVTTMFTIPSLTKMSLHALAEGALSDFLASGRVVKKVKRGERTVSEAEWRKILGL